MKKVLIFFLYVNCSILITVYTYAQWSDAYIPDFKVNDDNLNSYQVNSRIGVDSAGNFVIVWRDSRNTPGSSADAQIYCQRYNKNGIPLGNNFRIGQDTTSTPNITMLRDGRFIITWINIFSGNFFSKYEFYYQLFGSNGQPINPPARVIDSSFKFEVNVVLQGSGIDSDTSGNFVVCWSKADFFNTKPRVYFQRFDSSGNKIGIADSVPDTYSRSEYPDIAMNNNGSFVIAWDDDRNSQPNTLRYDIYLQKYNNLGIKIGNNIKVNDDTQPLQYRGGAKISTNGNEKIALTWTDPRQCGFGEIYYQLFNFNTGFIGINRKANNSPCGNNTGPPSGIALRIDGKFFIYWSDWYYSGREQSYGRRFDSTGNPIGNQYMIPMNSPSGTNQRADDAKILNDRIYSTWTYYIGTNNNTDIYCNVRGFQNPDTVIGIKNNNEIVNDFRLYPVYPNPFNPKTTIKYSLPNNSHVTIKIYDLLGRNVGEIVNEFKQAGYYSVSFDGSNFASGVYFYRIVADSFGKAGKFIDTKKMVLVK